MRVLMAIMGKELRSYFSSPIAYIFIILFLGYATFSFFRIGTLESGLNFFLKKQATLTDFLTYFPTAFMIMVPALAMRLWPDELKSGTMEVLATLPIRSWQIVLGKYLAALSIITLSILLTIPVALSVASIAREGGVSLDTGPVVAGYIGAFLTAAAFMAVGTFMAALAKEQVTAFLLALLVCFFLNAVGDKLSQILIGNADVVSVARFIGFSSRFENIERGVLDIRDLFYFLSFSVAFCLMNIAILDCRRWR